MPKKKSNVVPGPWTRPEDYAVTSILEKELHKQADAIFALEDSILGKTQTKHPWIRTKKNGARVSRIGINVWDLFLIVLLVVAISFVIAGYQFSFWDWACQNNQCQWISNIISQGEQ